MSPPVDTLATVSPEKSKTNPLGAGRNPRAGEAATAKITIRLTPTEHAAYLVAAACEEFTLGDWIRAACASRLPKPTKRKAR